MSLARLLRHNLLFYWRTNLAVIAGVAVAAAVLSGALLVGQSVRESLRDLALRRLGRVDYLISGDHFFRADLATAISNRPDFSATFAAVIPIIATDGILIHEKSGRRAYQVQVFGIDDRFWSFHEKNTNKTPEGREALLSESLAAELGARSNDALLLRLERQEGMPKESLFGKREDPGRTVRLVCNAVLAAADLGEFTLRQTQGSVYSVFVPMRRLQADLQQAGRSNSLLLSAKRSGDDRAVVERLLRESVALEDYGIRLRTIEKRNAIAIETDRIVFSDPILNTALKTTSAMGTEPVPTFTYLANTILCGERSIPYSVITAADLIRGALSTISLTSGVRLVPGEGARDALWLNSWAQRDLGAKVGDRVTLRYFLWKEEGRLVEDSADFRLAGVLDLEGDRRDPWYAPEFPGITTARNLTDWNPPFPIDLKRIRPKDEEYWKLYRTTPKAFVTLERGQELWGSRFGKASSIRLSTPKESDSASTQQAVASRLRADLIPGEAGFRIASVRPDALHASSGSTDFGEYFLYFSFFLICSAILLGSLFFRLGVEQRIREIGVLRAEGFPYSMVRNIFALEGLALSVIGGLAGMGAAVAYANFLLFGLRTWWIAAIGTSQLRLHLSPAPLIYGACGAVVISVLSVIGTLRSLRKNSTRSQLAGVLEPPALHGRRKRSLRITGVLSLLAGITLVASSARGWVDSGTGFFGAGSALLVALLCAIAQYLRRDRAGRLRGRGMPGIIRLSSRNASYRPGRSLLCVALVASSCFVIVSIEAFRHDPREESLDRNSGTGGFPLLAESVLPIIPNLNSPSGREALGLAEEEMKSLRDVHFTSFRARKGDDTSCLNLYAPQDPRVLGAPRSFLARGRFAFQSSLARTSEAKRNPWLLLDKKETDGALPAIADANTLEYILHLGLGQEVVLRGAAGGHVRLRFVAALKDSLLQGALILSEDNFLRSFPDAEGYRFFLIEAPNEKVNTVTAALETGLADHGFDVSSTRERLAAYHQVENTYLSTFQALGGLGVVLGTFGLATVLLRNVLERRREMALLRAVGYRRETIVGMVVAENAILLAWGLGAGTSCALIAVAPAWFARGESIPVSGLALLLVGILLAGLVSSLLAVVAAMRSPLLPALRSE